MWPGYYEDHKARIDKDFEEVEGFDITKTKIGFHASLDNQPYKVFVKKVKRK